MENRISKESRVIDMKIINELLKELEDKKLSIEKDIQFIEEKKSELFESVEKFKQLINDLNDEISKLNKDKKYIYTVEFNDGTIKEFSLDEFQNATLTEDCDELDKWINESYKPEYDNEVVKKVNNIEEVDKNDGS